MKTKTSTQPTLKTVLGQPSWRLASRDVECFVSELGGHVGPITFDRRDKKIKPYSVAPWAEEKLDRSIPPILRVLRGDFFCMPFGGNDNLFRGEKHPVHGETANAKWKFEAVEKHADATCLHLSLQTKVRQGRVDKRIYVMDGHNVIYSRHTISAMSGPMSLGHHAMLKFPDKPGSGLIATSKFRYGQVYVEPVEQPENQGYSMLKPGAEFDSLEHVPTITGENADLSRYPARRGFEDIVTLVADPDALFAWTAVTFPEEGYVWFALKDPRVLRATVFWISNGGRYYVPWNGRHVNVMGLEEVTSYFHVGLAESARKNPLADKGFKTSLDLNPKQPLSVNYIMGVAPIPRRFDHVLNIEADAEGQSITLQSVSGKSVQAPVNVGFLSTSA